MFFFGDVRCKFVAGNLTLSLPIFPFDHDVFRGIKREYWEEKVKVLEKLKAIKIWVQQSG